MANTDVWGMWFVTLKDFMKTKPLSPSGQGFFNLVESMVYNHKSELESTYFKNGTLDTTKIDYNALENTLKEVNPDLYTDFVNLGVFKQAPVTKTVVTKPTDSVWIRDFLLGKGVKESDIGWDAANKTVLLYGKPFMSLNKGDFVIESDKAYASKASLDKLFSQVTPPFTPTVTTPTVTGTSATQVGETTQVVQPSEPDYSKMTNFELSNTLDTMNLQGQLKGWDNITKLVNDNTSALSGAVNKMYDDLMKSSMDSLEIKYNTSKSALESQKGEVAANYSGALHDIDAGIMSARARTKTDMNARGMLFSSILTTALASVEVAGLAQKGKVIALKTADLNAIASQIAVLTSNYAISQDETKNTLEAQRGLKLLDILTTDQNQKMQIAQAQQGLQNQLDTMKTTEPARAEVATREEVTATADANLALQKTLLGMNYTQAQIDQIYSGIDLNAVKFDWQQTMDKEGLNAQAAQLGFNYDQLAEKSAEFQLDLQYRYTDLSMQDLWKKIAAGGTEGVGSLSELLGMSTADLLTTWGKVQARGVTSPISFEEYLKSNPVDKNNTTEDRQKDYNMLVSNGQIQTTTVLPEGAKIYDGLINTVIELKTTGANITTNNVKIYANLAMSIAQTPSFDVTSANKIIDASSDPVAKAVDYLTFKYAGNLQNIQAAFFVETSYIKDLLKKAGVQNVDDAFLLIQKAFGLEPTIPTGWQGGK